jgi:hypothetical protein
MLEGKLELGAANAKKRVPMSALHGYVKNGEARWAAKRTCSKLELMAGRRALRTGPHELSAISSVTHASSRFKRAMSSAGFGCRPEPGKACAPWAVA